MYIYKIVNTQLNSYRERVVDRHTDRQPMEHDSLSATEDVVVADCYTDQGPAEYGIHMIPTWYPAERGKTGIRRPVLTVVAIETCVVPDVHAVPSSVAPQSPSTDITQLLY